MNSEYMCIEEAPEPSPFHGKFEQMFGIQLVKTTTACISAASAVT